MGWFKARINRKSEFLYSNNIFWMMFHKDFDPVVVKCSSRTVKFIYSEKATKCCKIFTLLFSYVVPVKSKVKISRNFVAFSEYMNFTKGKAHTVIFVTVAFSKIIKIYLGNFKLVSKLWLVYLLSTKEFLLTFTYWIENCFFLMNEILEHFWFIENLSFLWF